jgi:hypothetical protein
MVGGVGGGVFAGMSLPCRLYPWTADMMLRCGDVREAPICDIAK